MVLHYDYPYPAGVDKSDKPGIARGLLSIPQFVAAVEKERGCKILKTSASGGVSGLRQRISPVACCGVMVLVFSGS